MLAVIRGWLMISILGKTGLSRLGNNALCGYVSEVWNDGIIILRNIGKSLYGNRNLAASLTVLILSRNSIRRDK